MTATVQNTQLTLAQVILDAMRSQLDQVWTAMPARVVSYDAAKQRCSAQPVIQKARVDGEGNRVTASLPVIADVPVAWPRGGAFRITFPLTPGDYVLLVFVSGSIDGWKVGGGANLDPVDDRRHNLSDAIAVAGVSDFGHPFSNVPPSNAASFGKDGGPTIDITASEIHAGGTSALALKADIDDLKSWAATHTHPATGGATGGPSSPPPSATGTNVLKGG